MSEIFPELAKLKGGKKNFWISQNLDLVAALNDTMGFDATARVLNMKADTLSRALVRAEGHHRPQVTKAEKALSRVALNEGKIYDLAKIVNGHSEALTQCFAEMRQVRDNLSRYFQLQSAASALMAEVMSNVKTTPDVPSFTQHIFLSPKRKVGPSLRIGTGRLFVYHGPRRNQLPGPSRSSHHRNYNHQRERGSRR